MRPQLPTSPAWYRDRLRWRFAIGRSAVADRGMISAETIAALEHGLPPSTARII
jgi:hypothetical protein